VRSFFVGLAVASAAVTLAVAPAQAVPATPCTSPLSSTTATGPLVVPAGETCSLTDVVVDGNIRIMAGGALLTHGSTLNGNVTGNNGPRTVQLIDTDVVGTGTTGNINLSGTERRIVIGSEGCAVDPATGNNINLTGNHGNIAICFMTVGETIALDNNDGRIGVFHNVTGNPLIVQNNVARFIRLRDNEVGVSGGGSILVQNNTTTGNTTNPNGLLLKSNHASNRLNCLGNDDAPVGSGNTADNGKDGQCVDL
jgi:hypothetical protein